MSLNFRFIFMRFLETPKNVGSIQTTSTNIEFHFIETLPINKILSSIWANKHASGQNVDSLFELPTNDIVENEQCLVDGMGWLRIVNCYTIVRTSSQHVIMHARKQWECVTTYNHPWTNQGRTCIHSPFTCGHDLSIGSETWTYSQGKSLCL